MDVVLLLCMGLIEGKEAASKVFFFCFSFVGEEVFLIKYSTFSSPFPSSEVSPISQA